MVEKSVVSLVVEFNSHDVLWQLTTFTQNGDQLHNESLIARSLQPLLSSLHVNLHLISQPFSLDGTLLRAWASQGFGIRSMVQLMIRLCMW